MRRLLTTAALAIAATALAAPAAHAADPCPNVQYRGGVAAGLPACRAWEQVSPQTKAGADVFSGNLGATTSVGVAGERVAYFAKGPFPGAESSPVYLTNIATRGSAWSSVGADPPADGFNGPTYSFVMDVSDDFSTALVYSTHKLTPDAVAGDTNVYLRDLSSGVYRLAFSSPGGDLAREIAFNPGDVVYAETPDLSQFVLSTKTALTADTPPNPNSLRYLYEWADGSLRAASVDSDGQLVESTANQRVRPPREQRWLSTDGRRLTLVLERPSNSNTAYLYQRIDGSSSVLIGRSRRGTPADATPVLTSSWWPTPDGTEVTFSDAGDTPLAPESPADGARRLYRWHADGDRLDDLLTQAGVPAGTTTNVDSILGQSPGGRYVWFSASGQPLANGATDGQPSFYVLDTASQSLRYVASTGVALSPDGTRALVQDTDPGTGGVSYSTFDGTRLSDAAVCVSCAAPGQSLGDAEFLKPYAISDTQVLGNQIHPITDDGRVFFDTPASLVGADADASRDVYGFTPGAGLSLVSSSAGSEPSKLTQVSADGRDVLFTTADPLVPQDTDALVDLYDARVGGGLAAQQIAPGAPAGCQGADCRGSGSPAPVRPTPAPPASPSRPRASFTVSGPSAAARRSAARTGRLVVGVKGSTAGKVSAAGRARVGRAVRSVGSASGRLERRGSMRLTLKLSPAARTALRRTGRLRVTVRVAFSPVAQRRELAIALTRPSAKRGGGR